METKFRWAYAEALSTCMHMLGLTTTELAARAGVTTQTVRNGLNGDSQNLEILILLWDALTRTRPNIVQMQIEELARVLIDDNIKKTFGRG